MMKKKNWISTILSMASERKGSMVLSVATGIISVACSMIPYFGIANIIILFLDNQAEASNVVFWVFISIGGYITRILFHMISTLASHKAAFTIIRNIRHKIAGKLMHAPLGTVLNETVGRLKNVMVDEVEKMETPLAHMIPEFISNLLIPVGIFAYMASVNWYMALASLASIPLGLIPYAMVMKTYKQKYETYMEANNYMNSTIVEYIEGIEVIKAFNQSTSSYEKYRNAVTAFRDYTLDWFKSTWKYTATAAAIMPSTLLVAMPIGLYLFISGGITAAGLTICLILALGIVEPLLKLADYVNEMQVIEYTVNSIDDFLNLSELPSKCTPVKLINHDIKLQNVSFSYTGEEDSNVLNGISLSLPENSFTALVGPSGGGKSTVARLIARFWDVSAGAIKIGGTDIRNIPLEQLMDTVSFVTQDNFLFNYSIMENIRLGNPAASDIEVLQAAQAACCDEFICKLENSYQTIVGDSGGRLSGGEKQRISIARAILKNAPIVILDEATAFVDAENEDKIQRSIANLTKGKTLLVIAHRLSTITGANQIVLLKDGEISAVGTHYELLEKSALYCDMWNAHIGAKQWAAGTQNELAKEVTSC